MELNQEGIDLIKYFEGCMLTAYLDNATPPVPTIAWGRTHYPNGAAVKLGDTCTQAQADEWLMGDIFQEGSYFIDAWVKVPVNENQYSALVSFCYNAGCGTFKRSQIFSALSRKDYDGAAEAFLIYDKAGGDPLLGLQRRRRCERELYNGGDWKKWAKWRP